MQLDRALAERRIFPALDLKKFGTRREELLLAEEDLAAVWKLRKKMRGNPLKDTPLVLNMLRNTKSNQDFMAQLSQLTGN